MDRRTSLISLWEFLKIPSDVIDACSVEYDLLCPHCRLAGRGDVHVVLLSDDTGFSCAAVGHQYRSHARGRRARVMEVDDPAASYRESLCVPT